MSLQNAAFTYPFSHSPRVVQAQIIGIAFACNEALTSNLWSRDLLW